MNIFLKDQRDEFVSKFESIEESIFMIRTETQNLTQIEKDVKESTTSVQSFDDLLQKNVSQLKSMQSVNTFLKQMLQQQDGKISNHNKKANKELEKLRAEHDSMADDIWKQINKLQSKLSDLYF